MPLLTILSLALTLPPAVEVRRLPAPEARQAVVADARHIYAISNSEIARYDRQTGERTATAIGNAILTSIFFGVAAGAGLTTAFITCVLVIAVIITCAMLLAVADLRSARKQGKTH